MLLEIDAAVFAGDEHLEIADLLKMIIQGRHEWRPDPAVALAAEHFTGTAMPNTPAVAEFVRKKLEESAYPVRESGPGAFGVTTVDAARLARIVRDLGREAVVVVEDQFSDPSFLLAVAGAFGHDWLVRAEERGWLRFAHAGGKDRMDRFVAAERRKFAVVVRVAAVLDSDRSRPGQRTGNHDRAERIRAVDGVTEVHIWEWREVENYVPTRVWEHHIPHQRAKISTLRAMPPEQRGYCEVDKMLSARNRRAKAPSPLMPPEHALTEADFAELGADAVAELRTVLAMISRIV